MQTLCLAKGGSKCIDSVSRTSRCLDEGWCHLGVCSSTWDEMYSLFFPLWANDCRSCTIYSWEAHPDEMEDSTSWTSAWYLSSRSHFLNCVLIFQRHTTLHCCIDRQKRFRRAHNAQWEGVHQQIKSRSCRSFLLINIELIWLGFEAGLASELARVHLRDRHIKSIESFFMWKQHGHSKAPFVTCPWRYALNPN